MEALALENHLIKQRAPRYNILLRDDKNYPYLQLTTGEAFPRVLVARRVQRDGHYYAGPFLPASLGRRTMALTHRLFGIRSATRITGARPPVSGSTSSGASRRASAASPARAIGRSSIPSCSRGPQRRARGRSGRMQEAAEAERFEQAAELRDAIRTIDTLGTRQQKMASAELGDRDAFGLKVGPAGASVQVFEVRHGRVVERIELVTDGGDSAAAEPGGRGGRRAAPKPEAKACQQDVLQAVQQFYEDRVPPPEIHLPLDLGEADATRSKSGCRRAARVRLVVPKRGEKRGLLELAARNAELAYQQRFNENTAANYDALETLRAVLALPAVPRRIECFDISTIQGSETVASMVVCEDGRMRKGEYRNSDQGQGSGSGSVPGRSRVRGLGLTLAGAAAARAASPEPLRLCFDARSRAAATAACRGAGRSRSDPHRRRKGQLSAVGAALEELAGALIAVGIAKKEELLFTAIARCHGCRVRTRRASSSGIRDEAHASR
jgi:excinuclease ABC subunit C